MMQLLLAAVLATAPVVSAIQIWKTPGEISTSVPAKCRSPLTQNITCDFLVSPDKAAVGQVLVGGAADVYCSATCRTSLETFQQKVVAGCGATMYALWVNSTLTQSGKALADGFIWAHNLVCIKDNTGFCLADLYAGNKTECSDCAFKYGAAMLGSDYGRVRVEEDDFKSRLSSCSIPASSYPYTYTSTPVATVSTSTVSAPATTSACAGTMYTVRQGDTCQSISLANSVATDRMIDTNHLDYSCSSLAVGMKLCIKEKCELATIQTNQTCDSIVKDRGFSVIQLQSWNPTLKSMCNSNLTPNLDTLAGRSICIKAPGEVVFPTAAPTFTTQNWTLQSPMFTSWDRGVVETSPAVGTVTVTSLWDPNYTPPAETAILNSTYDAIVADRTKYCWITEEDWVNGYDPESMAQACQNLMETYCYYQPSLPSPTALTRAPAVCTPDRSTYTIQPNPDPVPTPRPYQTGMTLGCNAFYKVVSGDTCDAVLSKYSLTFADFFKWNPAVGSECRNLQVNVWVCVGYDERLVPTAAAKL